MTEAPSVSERIVRHLTHVGETVACAESLTAGLVSATIADTPGASVVLRGGIVAYAADVKVALLGVPASVVADVGTVDPRVARSMAEGAKAGLGATWGIATTGVAGPGPAEGKPAGTVHVAVAGPAGTVTRALRLNGTRDEVRRLAADAVLALALEVMTGSAKDDEGTVHPTDGLADGSGDRRGDHRGDGGANGQTAAPS